MTQQKFEAVLIDEGGGFLAQRVLIVELAERHRLPICYPYRDYVDLGGLMAYAPDLGELAQRLADNVHQILNGAKPGDIPIYQPTRFQLVVNLKAAKTTRPHRAVDSWSFPTPARGLDRVETRISWPLARYQRCTVHF